MADEFKVGDVVRLKSGGPAMTITNTLERGGFECTWFSDRKNGVKFSSLPPSALTSCVPDDVLSEWVALAE